MKRLICFAMAAALALTGVCVSVPAQAASVKKISMKTGDTKKLSVFKGKNTFKVSKNCVKVSKTGKVTAMKGGTATVTVKKGKKQKKYKITVKDVCLSIDYSKVSRATVIDLTYGTKVDLDAEHLQVVKDALQEKNLVKDLILTGTKKKSGSGKYGIHLYDAAGKELYNITISLGYVSVYGGDCYRMKKVIDFSGLQALFA